uniref:Major capsid protein n=1 Tax=Dulem virus 206 TaxID=3145683 RepID=A0AAU8B6U7_9VIRU
MNRNSEQHFSQLPHAQIPRAQFKRDFSLLTTINEGDLVPIYVDEVLPADTAKINLNGLIRMATPLYPVMDNCYCDFYFFFVPARLLWEHFQNLMGQNDSTFWAETTEYTTPQVTAPEGGWDVGTIADYMGIPTGVEDISVNALPFRAYAKIWNEWFRDENLQQPVVQDIDDATNEGSNAGTALTDAQNGGLPLKVAKYKDYFTSALPAPQRGPSVEIPIGVTITGSLTQDEAYDAPVYTQSTTTGLTGTVMKFYKAGTTTEYSGSSYTKLGYNSGLFGGTDSEIPTSQQNLAPSNLYAKINATNIDLNIDSSSGAQATINQLRQAIALQHIYERDARTGTRYKEILQGAWGVTSPDARLDRSEYIGGYRLPININQVIQTSATDSTSPQGNTAAYSMTTVSKHMATYSATEHGYILGLAAIRVDHSYQQGLSRMWTRSDRFSYYDPMLANLGEQAILNKEIYAQGTDKDDEVFGYQEAWADYRYRTNMVTSEMRSQYEQTLDAWHYADYYTTLPTLSAGWIQESTENIDRTLAVQSETSHQFIANFFFDQTWTRPMPVYSIPGLNTI